MTEEQQHPVPGANRPGLSPSLDGASFDAIVIGAGILGAGVARELARRGQRTLVVERRDIGWGTTNRSTRLVHGGLRYLEHLDLPLVREGLRERGWLLRAVPHLVTPLGLLLPYYQESWFHRTQLRAGLTLYDILAPRRSLPRHRSLSAAKALALEPALAGDGLHSAGFYWDGQVELPERLVVEILRAAEGWGATIVTRCRAMELRRVGRCVTGVTIAPDTGLAMVGIAELPEAGPVTTMEVHAPLVINASGPWADGVLADLGLQRPPILRLTQGVHLQYPLRTRYAVAFEHPEDGRLCFAIPWQGGTLVGTTDTDVDGGPEAARATREEVRYVDSGARFLFPEAAASRPIWAEVGVRSLMRHEGSAGAISRKHVVVDHASEGAQGLTTVAGGKLTAWRSIAVDVVDQAIGRRDPDALKPVGLRGEPLGPPRQLGVADMMSGRLPTTREDRLSRLYGGYASEITASWGANPWSAVELIPGVPVTRAEVTHAVEREWATAIADIVLRRLALGFDLGLARQAGQATAEVAREHLGWSDARIRADLDDLERELTEHAVAGEAAETPGAPPAASRSRSAGHPDGRSPRNDDVGLARVGRGRDVQDPVRGGLDRQRGS
jgi:glycerol-3-phosphate dehydrogenase